MPAPETLREYAELIPDAPERIMRMAEAETVDKSSRQDRLVDAEIQNAKSDRGSATFFLTVFFIASVVFFAVGNPIAGGCLLSIPVLGLIKTMWPTRGE